MPTYSLIFALKPRLKENEIKHSIMRMARIVCPSGGLIHKFENFGLRTFSDRKSRHGKTFDEGRYIRGFIEARPEVIRGLDKYISSDESVILWKFKKEKMFKLEALEKKKRKEIINEFTNTVRNKDLDEDSILNKENLNSYIDEVLKPLTLNSAEKENLERVKQQNLKTVSEIDDEIEDDMKSTSKEIDRIFQVEQREKIIDFAQFEGEESLAKEKLSNIKK